MHSVAIAFWNEWSSLSAAQMPDRPESASKDNSSGKRRRISRSICNGRRRRRISDSDLVLDISEPIANAKAPSIYNDGVRRELDFSSAPSPTGGRALASYGPMLLASTPHYMSVSTENEELVSLDINRYAGVEVVDDEDAEEAVESQVWQSLGTGRIYSEVGYILPSSHAHGNMRTEFEKRAAVFMDPRNIIALIFACGTNRFSRNQYDETCRLVWMFSRDGPNEMKFPSYSTLKRKVEVMAIFHSYAGSRIHTYTSHNSFGGRWETLPFKASTDNVANLNSGSGVEEADRAGTEPKTHPVVIILPSQWVLMDVATGPIYRLMFGERIDSGCGSERTMFETIDDCPIVRDREGVMSCETQVFVSPLSGSDTGGNLPYLKERLPVSVTKGDTIELLISDRSKEFTESAGRESISVAPCGNYVSLRGIVVSVSVHSSGQDPTALGECSIPTSFEQELRDGDYVVRLRGEEQQPPTVRKDFVLLLVYRFYRKETREQYIFVLFKGSGSSISRSSVRCRPIKVPVKSVAAASAIVRNMAGGTLSSPSKGILKDGRPYLVYRMLLYCDDFKPYLGKRDSYGGCYMLPLGLPPANRAGAAAVRVLGLTPPGVSTNEVLRAIIPDIIRGTTRGFTTVDGNGREVVVFLDVVGYIGDTPAISHVLDLRGHTALAPCPWCSFCRSDTKNHLGSRYGAPVSVNSRHPSFVRFGIRAKLFRGTEPSDKDCQTLGFTHKVPAESTPLHELASALLEVKKSVPLNAEGRPVVSACLDPYRACVVAPDHLFFGLSQNVIAAVLYCCSVEERKSAEACMLISLREHQLSVQNKLFADSGACLLPMSISQVRSVVLVAPAVFRSVKAMHSCPGSNAYSRVSASGRPYTSSNHAHYSRVLFLLEMFQILVAETAAYPVLALDGRALVREFNRDSGRYRMNKLYGMACRYVKELDEVCKLSSKLCEILDKPNVHRLIELYAHTIPAYGHVKHITELLFESAHQPLKRGITNSNHSSPQVAAVYAALQNDWESRLALELVSDKPYSSRRVHRIQRLLLGREFPSSLKDEPFAGVDPIRVPYLLTRLARVRQNVHSAQHSETKWVLRGAVDVADNAFESNPYPGDEKGLTWNSGAGGHKSYSRKHGRMMLFDHADRYKPAVTVGGAKLLGIRLGTIQVGSVVQCPILEDSPVDARENEIPLLRTNEHDSRGVLSGEMVSFWYVSLLIGHEQGSHGTVTGSAAAPYAQVLPCKSLGTADGASTFVVADSCPRILMLGPTVREVLCIHACDKSSRACTIDPASKKVCHGGRLIDGDEFYMYGRKDGYPPRIA